ncbi:MAG: error-prone DNA polymerase [Hyphomicrobiaceae bacterium]
MTTAQSDRWQAAPPAYAELAALTNFSFLEGASHPHEMVAAAKALGLSALAVTDRNSLAGVVRAHVAAKEVGLKLIVGARLDLVDAPSLIALPIDRAAYGRLSRLLSLGQRRAEKGQCELYLRDVSAHAEGLILIALAPDDWDWREALAIDPDTPSDAEVISLRERGWPRSRERQDRQPLFTAPIAAPFPATLVRIRDALTPAAAGLYLAATHRHTADDRARIGALAHLATHLGLPLVVTGDVRYHSPDRRQLADVLTAIRTHTTVAAAGHALAPNAERHLKSPAAMARLFRGHEDALARTVEVAARCTFSLDELVYEYPDEPVPPGETPQSQLEKLTWAGADHRFPGGIPAKVRATLEKELALIESLNYAPYFLTVHDIVHFARSRGILCQGRGSAANSAVCYCLAITAVNPIEIDLLFERFVAPERKEPPDIDVDFEHERREEVIQYIYARYGRHRAGLAATVISYRARSAVREVGKAMGLSEDTVAALAGMVWGTRSGGVLPEKHVREAGLDPADPLLAAVLALADELTGFPRHLSQHVGGFVLTRGRLDEVVPISNAAMEDRTVICWDKDDIDALGLLKVDVLALGMLTCIRRAFALIGANYGLHMTLASVPREDAAVYDMLCRADSLGVFQVESRAQMNMLPRLKPRTFYDLVIEVAIVRPGPIQGDMVHPYLRRRSGLEAEHYPSPAPEHGPADELRQILGKTKGVPLFQEQAMRIAMEAAKFNGAEINELRRALATFRRRGTIHLLEEKMVSRMVARGYDPTFAARCFNQIKGFGEYGFPESHAASFAHLVYVSSWLKCHYPEVFAAALLNSQPMGFYAPAQIVRDAREHGVEVREVDVNASDWDCSLEARCDCGRPCPPDRCSMEDGGHRGALRLGLRQIDGLAEAAAQHIVEARGDRPYRDVHDLWMRAGVGRAVIERLAAADAFRSMGLDRRQALWQVRGLGGDVALPLFAWSEAREEGTEPTVTLPEMGLSEHVVSDYQTLRLSLKAHPVSFLRERLDAARVAPCAALASHRDGARADVAGVVLVRQRPGSAKGVVFMTIEDETGIANCVVWPNTLEKFRRVIMTARLIRVTGRIQRHEDIIHVVSTRLEDLSPWLADLTEAHDKFRPAFANADEVLRPDPGSARSPTHPRWSEPRSVRHPREERVIPKRTPPVLPRSRDFH